MVFPDIIVLNGTSSSGKASLAAARQGTLEAIYVLVSIDAFWRIYPQKAFSPGAFKKTGEQGVAGFHRCVAALAWAGDEVVVETMLADPTWAKDCITVLQPFDTIYAGIHCPLEEPERRERARGDRAAGLARQQLGRCTCTSNTTLK